jgi:CheY-like chemotaxis protein
MQNKVNILVVDDSPSWCSIYEEALADGECCVRIATNLVSALDALNQMFFHVAIVDIRLDMNDRYNAEGLDVLQRIWELNEGTFAIVSSGHATVDMLPSFRAYGIFDFVAKAELSPADLARQYKSAAFIRGAIDKAGSLTDSLSRIQQAVVEARHIAANKQWLVSPFRVFRGFSSKDMQTSLKGAGTLELRPFLGQLCRPLFPWLHGQQTAQLIKDGAGNDLAIEGYAWSRAFGKPMVIRAGRRESFEQANHLVLLGSSWPGAAIGDQIFHQTSPHFEGVVCSVSNMAFEGNFNPPRPRRTNR